MSSRILLVTSSFEGISLVTAAAGRRSGVKTTDESHYPLGLAYLHSYLEAQGNKVHTLFANNFDYQTCMARTLDAIEEFSPDIVGLQIMTPNRVSSYRLIESIHERYPQIQIVAGGIHATIMYAQMIEKYPFLMVVRGEGEISFSELAKELRNERPDLRPVDGIAFRDGDSVVATRDRHLIEDLDTLPFPRHELFFAKKRASGCILTTRGCPFCCSFCSLDSVSRRKVRRRSVKNVVDEIEHMVGVFPSMTEIWIHDDNFLLDNDRAIEFCEEIVRRKIQLDFTCSARPKPLTKEVVMKLEEANFKKVLFGLESGDETVLKASQKGITPQDVVDAFKLFSDSEIEVYAFLMVGLPGETAETVRRTVRLVNKLQRIKYVTYQDDIAITTVYPGTQLYEIAKTAGMMSDDFWLLDRPTPLFDVENSQERLLQFKEVILNHICLDRLSSAAGFAAQCRMLPYLVRDKGGLSVLSQLVRLLLPGPLHETLRRRRGVAKKVSSCGGPAK